MSDASKARLRLWLRLLKAQRTIEAEIREKLRRDHDTTLPRFDVMAALWRVEKGLKMSELSGQLRVSNGNVTGIVDRLVEDGLIERLPVEGDRRAMRVRLTGEGRASFSEMAEVHEGWVDQMLSGIEIDVAEDMASQLHEITEHIDRRNPS